jgi:CHAD domain-containing protein/CYTH domain-containing protein
MNTPPNLPSLPVDEGSRRLALAHLQDAVAARSRVTGSPDADALHDYRVAVRRLRSCLRAYAKPLRSSLTGKTLRRLRRLAHGTNRSRDLDVHLAWLGEQGHTVGEAERLGVAWLLERLTADRDRAWEDMLDLDETLFPRIHARLVRRLSRFRTTIDLDERSQRRSTATVAARRVRAASGLLKERLRRVQGYSSVDAIHRARIAAKHLRYLLEPFTPAVPEGQAAVDRLKALQDGFGDAHDAHVFGAELMEALPDAERAASVGASLVPGLEALMASLQARGQQAYDRIAAGWLGAAGDPFFTGVDTLAEEITDLVDRDREVERKFLLTGLPTLPGAGSPVEIEQGYLPGERLIERVRRIRSDEGEELIRTVNEGSGLTRLEVEEPVSADVFDRLWPLTEGRRLRKRRYRIPDGDLTWEIDEFLDRDLVLAEVELAGRPVDVEVPAWLQPHVDREVTEDEAYSNLRLASSR